MGHSFKPGLIMEHFHIIFTFRMRGQFKDFIQNINAKGIYCVVPERIHTHPMEDHQKFLVGRGGLKSQNFRNKCEAKLEFPRERKGAFFNKMSPVGEK